MCYLTATTVINLTFTFIKSHMTHIDIHTIHSMYVIKTTWRWLYNYNPVVIGLGQCLQCKQQRALAFHSLTAGYRGAMSLLQKDRERLRDLKIMHQQCKKWTSITTMLPIQCQNTWYSYASKSSRKTKKKSTNNSSLRPILLLCFGFNIFVSRKKYIIILSYT